MGTRGFRGAVLGAVRCAIAAAVTVPCSLPGSASAQTAPGGASTTSTLRRGTRGGSSTTAGRAAMKAGDCTRALDDFDDALRVALDSTVRRDRGLCHEALGDTYPAIDDFRAYLTVYPNASDSEDIRGRLRRLKEQIGEGGEGAASADDDAAAAKAGGEAGTARGETSRPGDDSSLEAIKSREAETDASRGSSLRAGRGFIVGPYVNFRYFSQRQYGSGDTYGLAMRYAFGPAYTLLTELGYSSIRGGGGATGLGGLTTFLGLEGRVPLDRYVTNALFLGAGLGYERLTQSATVLTYSTFIPRVRGGWRHVFGPNLGLELGVDAGYALLNLTNSPDGHSSSVQSLVIGGNAAFVIGF